MLRITNKPQAVIHRRSEQSQSHRLPYYERWTQISGPQPSELNSNKQQQQRCRLFVPVAHNERHA